MGKNSGVKPEHNHRMIHNVLKCHNKTLFPTKFLIKSLDKKIRNNFKNYKPTNKLLSIPDTIIPSRSREFLQTTTCLKRT